MIINKTNSNHFLCKGKPLLFISFFSGIKGNCPAEWADDKLNVLDEQSVRTYVITGVSSHIKSLKNIVVYKVPSISWNDFNEELKEVKAIGKSPSLYSILMFPIATTLGRLIDFIMRKITNGISSGYWSWTISALPLALYLIYSHKISKVFTTGGPSSAHFIGALLTCFKKVKLYVELQDPLVGATMNRSHRTKALASKMEAWLCARSERIIYVTHKAAELAKVRHSEFSYKIEGIYPGARNFKLKVALNNDPNVIELLHLGTLYGTRNLDSFFIALDDLKKEYVSGADKVRVINLGANYCYPKDQYQKRNDYFEINTMERVDSIERAMHASGLLLIQHADDRSSETIPYKTYDYLNIDLPIFGLLMNEELSKLVEQAGGFTASISNIKDIKRSLKKFLKKHQHSRIKYVNNSPYPITKQFLTIFKD